MAGRIPEDVISKIREDTAIEEVIGLYVTLTRKGNSYWGRCPFHDEKTPSFHVVPDRESYYCFGCQRGGSVFRFLMDHQGMGFVEAVEWCADRLGLDLARYVTADEPGRDQRESIYEANRWAEQWFAERLQGAEGREAREYARSRGLAPETIESFGLGYAPRDGDAISRAAREAGIAQETLLQAAILGRKEHSSPFAYFRSRLIFPIRGVAKKTHGFGGRILGPGEPKYLNSPETPVFRKRQTLYGLPDARPSLVKARTAILVEGYLDAIALHQAGWTQTVATCGTAFTEEQAKALKRLVNELVLFFDGDAAGRKAAMRSAEIALIEGLEVRIARLPAGMDPADLLLEGERDTVQAALQEAPTPVEYLRREVEERGGARPIRERALAWLRDCARRMKDPLRGELLLDEAAAAFKVTADYLKRGGSTSRSGRPSADSEAPPVETVSEEERRLLRLAMSSRRARLHLLAQRAPQDFSSTPLVEIAERLRDLGSEVDEVRTVQQLEAEGTDLEPQIAAILIGDSDAEVDAESFDAVEEIDALLEVMRKREESERAQRERARLDEEYQSGGDWKERLRRRSHGDPHTPESPGNQD